MALTPRSGPGGNVTEERTAMALTSRSGPGGNVTEERTAMALTPRSGPGGNVTEERTAMALTSRSGPGGNVLSCNQSIMDHRTVKRDCPLLHRAVECEDGSLTTLHGFILTSRALR
ncbi:hypothetical protein NHX12_008990 [Muraenolepis orangiensis]|uniref:Uncharacterized protein n=1 Tax=Muraenolepis orangiensis TaxID=630683 RepID=A0A9Q0IAQ8_9TELE|nr:hypothetical protein NHX12_008990 [Muraenolepis orangiensis]